MACDYSTPEFGRKCRGGRASVILRVRYNAREEDALSLCPACAERLRAEAEVNNWIVKTISNRP